jgi:lysophospholipase L1-like esterase
MHLPSLSVLLLLSSLGQAPEAPKGEKPWEPARRVAEYPWMPTANWNARHDKFLRRAGEGSVEILFLGDSITEGWGNNAIWRERYTPQRAANFGIGGDTTQNVLWRVTHGEVDGLAPKVVVLMIGTNNFGLHDDGPEDVARGVAAIVHELTRRLPDSKILLLGMFPRDEQPGTDHRKRIEEANKRIACLDDGSTVRYLDLGPKLTREDGTIDPAIMPDYLHLSEAGYKIWADEMAGLLDELRNN